MGFIGMGRAGTALAQALAAADYPVAAVAGRTPEHARSLAGRFPPGVKAGSAQDVADAARIVFITTPDDAIEQVASSTTWRPGQAVVHCSGVLSLGPLEAAGAQGAQTGSFHPLFTFGPAGTVEAQALHGAAFGLDGEPPLRAALSRMARRLGGVPVRVPPEARPLYHAAAVLVCGYFVPLFSDAVELWRKGGLPQQTAAPALAHLVQATLHNLVTLGAAPSQTGPVPRGDTGTVRAHIEMLGGQAPDLLPAYMELARRAVALSLATGRQPSSALPAWQELLKG